MDKIETPRAFVENHTGYGGDKFNALVQDITSRDALLRADERQKAAERAINWFTGQGEDPDELAERLRAAIMAKPQMVDDDWTEMAKPEGVTK